MSDAEDAGGRGRKSPGAYRTISEVADDLHVPQHVLRFWETKFAQIRPLKRGGGRRYYRPEDIALLRRISDLLYIQGYTIKGVQRLLREGDAGVAEGAPEPDEAELPADDTSDEPPPARPQLALPGMGDGVATPAAKPVVRVRAESSLGTRPAPAAPAPAAPAPAAPAAPSAVPPAPAAPAEALAPAAELAAARHEVARLRGLLAEAARELHAVRALLGEAAAAVPAAAAEPSPHG